MKPITMVVLLSLAIAVTLQGEESRFFRVTGPVLTTITRFSADGYVTWTNEPTNGTFTIQTATSLVGNWVDYVQIPITNGVNTNRIYDPNPPFGMTLIPAGSFMMGNPFSGGDYDERPTHTVFVSAFYMDRYEVTKELWDEVYQWATNHGYSFDNPGYSKATNHPVVGINWHDAVKWCNARSEKEARTPAYYTSLEQTNAYRVGRSNVQSGWVNWNSGYRLPTEAEWEKAARGGASGHRFPWSNVDTIDQSQANYSSFWSSGHPAFPYDVNATEGYHPAFNDGIQPFTSPVGYFAPNGYGLYDMAANVWEWCWDLWDDLYYSSSPGTDPRGPDSGSLNRLLRSGSWNLYANYCHVANRRNSNTVQLPTERIYGFRSVLPPGQ